MAISRRRLKDLKLLAVAVLLAAVVGTVYDLFHGLALPVALAGGGVIGALIAGVLMSAQLFGLATAVRRRLRRFPPAASTGLMFVGALVVVVAAIQVGTTTGGWVAEGPVPLELDAAGIVFSLGVSAIFIAATSLDRMVGTDVLLSIFTGRYLTPRREHRIFLFADLVGSTALAERLGDVDFHRYMDELVRELTEPVARHGGQIYRYVGDQMIVTWRAERDPAEAARNALACVRECRATLTREAGAFETRFGQAPDMHFVLHAGPVVAGRMGEVKREIVFMGDTVNTTARMEDIAKRSGRRCVASDNVIDALPASEAPEATDLQVVDVRGKHQRVQLYAVAERGPIPAQGGCRNS